MKLEIRSAGQKMIAILIVVGVMFSMVIGTPKVKAVMVSIGALSSSSEDGNILIFNSGQNQVMVELCTDRTVRVQMSGNGKTGYRPYDREYYMVQKNNWSPVTRTVTEMNTYISVKTAAMEIRIEKNPIRIGMYDLTGKLLSKDTAVTGMYRDGNAVGVRKEEGTQNAGGIFGFGSGDHGRRANLNRYNQDFSEFSMSHGRVVAPFFMSSVGYGVFLNTIKKNTVFYQKGGGFQTEGYLDYYFMYGPDFKAILNEYSEITGRMEMYGKWAHGFMLSKYGNDNATQAEFSTWINRLRDEGYPADSYVFDYGWRGDIADNGGNQTGAGQKWGKQMWSNDFVKFPDIDAMFQQARELGFRVGLHNNAGTPEASGGNQLYIPEIEDRWVKSYMDSVITTGHGDWFWPDEFDVLGSNTAPTFSSKGAYEAWKDYTVESRPMFITRGSYAGQHFATAWSGDINNTSTELSSQIGFSIDTGLIGYWASSHDLGGFMGKPGNELYTRWVSEFGAWNAIMRTHGHDGREPWLYDTTAQKVLKENLKTRYALYPYIYTMAWQGYSQGVPMMRAMLLEDGSQYNPEAWNLNQQYYFGDWFLVAPAVDTADTSVSVWLPPNSTWYNYYSGELYEGGASGKTIHIAAALEDIPVFVKAGAIVPMGPNVDYADEFPLDPLTLDIYPSGTSTYTLYEDDGLSRRYITENAYSTTDFTSVENDAEISFHIGARVDHNALVYQPDPRSYNLKFNHLEVVRGVKLNGNDLVQAASLSAYNNAGEAYWLDTVNRVLYVKVADTGGAMDIVLDTDGIVQPDPGNENQGLPPQRIQNGDLFELEKADFKPVPGGQVQSDNEWKGYTGTGFAKGFKAVGDALEFKVNVVRDGTYNLEIRVNNGKKNSAQYDNTPRTAGLYLDGGKAAELAFTVTDKWGDGNKNGEWRSYTIEGVHLEAGVHTFRIVSEGSNAGNFNLDSLKFIRLDTSIDAFSTIEAETANILSDTTVDTENGIDFIHTTTGGAWARYGEVTGSNKGGIEMRIKSSTGGSIIVYENGVGDKILSTIKLPADGQWTTLKVDGKDTDAVESNIFLEFKAKEGQSLDVCVDWFKFIRSIDAYNLVEAKTASERQGIDIHNSGNYLNHIENGDWARFDDIDFGDEGVTTAMVNVAAGLQGGIAKVYIDNMDESSKVAEIEIKNTGNWSTFVTYTGDCANVTGIHRVYIKFVSSLTTSICDFVWIQFSNNSITVEPEVLGGTANLQISNNMAKPGDTVTFQITELNKGYAVKSICVEDSKKNKIPLKQIIDNVRYSFTQPVNVPVKVIVELHEKWPEIRSGTVIELEDGEGVTNENNTALRVDRNWPNYSGTGYVAGWKTAGNYVQFKAEVMESGSYELTLRGAIGPKNEAQYDATPRQGALYIDNVKVADFGLAIQENWGIWIEHIFEAMSLDVGIHTFKIVSEGDVNPGNFNLDHITFAIVIDKGLLQALVDEVADLEQGAYTDESWTAFTAARSAARNILNSHEATQADVYSAYNKLLAAKEGLTRKPVPDKSKLETLIAEADGMDLSLYTDSSKEIFRVEVTKAKAVMADEYPTKGEVDTAIVSLETAMENLTYRNGSKAVLTQLIQTYSQLKEEGFTTGSWNVYANALNEAQVLINRTGDITIVEELNASSKLTQAVEGLIPKEEYKIELQKLIDSAKALLVNEDVYIQTVLKEIKAQVTLAETMMLDDKATRDDVETMTEALNHAITNLYAGNTTELNKKVANAREILDNADEYAPTSVAGLQTAIAKAQAVIDNAHSVAADLSKALMELSEEIAKARYKADKADLIRLVKAAGAIDIKLYTADSVSELYKAMTQSNAILDDPDTTKSQVDDAYIVLDAAVKALKLALPVVPGVDKSKLEALFEANKNIVQGDCTDESWSTFQNALTTVLEVLLSENITQLEVDDTVKLISYAINALEKKPVKSSDLDEGKSPKTGNSGSLWISIMLMMISAGGLLIMFIARKRCRT